MKSKALAAGLFVLLVCFLMGIPGDVGTELPSPPVPNMEDTSEEADQPGLSGYMATAGNNPAWVNCGGKLWVNYDFLSKSIAQNNVAWPIMIIFYGNATVNKVKDIYGGMTIWGASQDEAYDIGGGTQWDSDRGTKVSVYFGGPDGYDTDTLHLRIYSPSSTDYFSGDGGWGIM